MKRYKILVTDESKVHYEDDSCIVNLLVANFRDPCLWIEDENTFNKVTQEKYKLNQNQLLFLYKRIAYHWKQDEVYNAKLHFIKSKDYNPTTDDEINLLEVE